MKFKCVLHPANEILEFPIGCNVSISIMNKTKGIKRERFSFRGVRHDSIFYFFVIRKFSVTRI